MCDAAARGELRHVHDLLEEGVDPDWCSPEDGLTPLHIAALKGRAECLLRLLRAGADIYATGAHGCTALDLFEQQKILFRVCDKLFQSRSYKNCRTYLMQAHADCQHRAEEWLNIRALSCSIRAKSWASFARGVRGA